MISLKRMVEQQGAEGQYYDLGKDFANFKRMIDGADDKIKQQYEQQINTKLAGKRVRARASRGYKQYLKDYEFDISKVTLDNYYDNFVVVAHDTSTPKAKEYFLKSGYQIQILGPATGQPSPQKGGNPKFEKSPVVTPMQDPTKAQSQPMTPAPPTVPSITPEQPVREEEEHHEGYSIDTICQDVTPWLPSLLKKPSTAVRDFVKGIGWAMKNKEGKKVAMFDLDIPFDQVKRDITQELLNQLLKKTEQTPGYGGNKYSIAKFDIDRPNAEWHVRIKKIIG
jgi:hypothetical protein